MINQVFRFSTTVAFRHTLEVWRRGWATLLLLTCVFEAFGWITFRLFADYRIFQQVYQSLWGIAVESVFLLVIPKMYKDWLDGKSYSSTWNHVKHHAEAFTIESLRVLGRVVLGLLLFVVPGLIRVIQYYFVGYVLQFDPRYEKGQLDALEGSKSLVKGRAWPVVVVLTLVFLLSLLGQLRDLMKLSDVATGAAFLLTLFMRVYTQVILFYFYQALNDSPLKGQKENL